MEPEISIIIPAHNEEKYITSTINSIKNQKFKNFNNLNFETIIVTNGCTDNTENIITNLIKENNQTIKHYSTPEAHVSKARNLGAEKANGNILLFLDADTLLDENMLDTIKQQFTEKYSVATTLAKPDLNGFKYKFSQDFKNFYHKYGLYCGCSGALICRKNDFFNAGKYPEIAVKEHRKLIKNILNSKTPSNSNKFKCVDSYVTTSMRRFKDWGIIKSSYFWTKEWLKDKIFSVENSDYEKIR